MASRLVPERVMFRHDKEKLYEALGIQDGRADEIIELVQRLAGESDTFSEVIEKIVNHDGISDAEKIYAIINVGLLIALQASLEDC